MKLQRYEIRALDDWGGRIHWQPSDAGQWCAAAHVEQLKAENAALHAECDRLTAMLGLQKVLSAEEVTEPGYYWWGSNLAKGWDGIMKVARTRYGYRFDEELWGAGSNGLYGQFIGPIKMPEVQG